MTTARTTDRTDRTGPDVLARAVDAAAFGATVALDDVSLDVRAGQLSACWAPTAPASPRCSAW